MTKPAPTSAIDAISFRQLKLFQTVGRLQSVRQASEACNLSQPAVTQAIAKLESLLDEQLLERSVNGSYLTELGTVFHQRVDRFYDQFHQALHALSCAASAATIESMANRISRSQIKSLIAIFDSGSLDRAASATGISQPSIQRSIRTLEGNLGKPVLSRNAAGTSITSDGAEFGKRMKLALLEIEAGQRDMDFARGQSKLRVTVGAMPFGGSVLLASVLDEFLSEFPEAEIRITSEDSAALQESLTAGNVDFVVGLIKENENLDLKYQLLAETPYLIVARKGHQLLSKSDVTIKDLLAQEWIIATRLASRRECFETVFEGTPGPRAAIRTSAHQVIRRLLETSDRLTLMTTFEQQSENSQLGVINFQPSGPSPSIGITTRSNWLPTLPQKRLMDLISARAAMAANPPALLQAS